MKFFNRTPKTQSTVSKKREAPQQKLKKNHSKPDTIENTTASLRDAMSEILVDQGGLEPMIFCDFDWIMVPESVDKVKTGIGLVLGEEQTEKRREVVDRLGSAMAILSLLGVLGKPTYVKMASEAWAAFPEKDDYDPEIRPSEHPDRKEVLMVSVMDRDHTIGVSVRDLIRDENKTELKDTEHTEVFTSKNDYVSILSDFWTAYERGLQIVKEEGHYKVFKDIAKKDPVHTYELVLKTMLQGLI